MGSHAICFQAFLVHRFLLLTPEMGEDISCHSLWINKASSQGTEKEWQNSGGSRGDQLSRGCVSGGRSRWVPLHSPVETLTGSRISAHWLVCANFMITFRFGMPAQACQPLPSLACSHKLSERPCVSLGSLVEPSF